MNIPILKAQKIILATVFSLLSFCSIFAQTDNTKIKDGTISTGAAKAFPGALLELESNNKGLLTSRLTTAQRDGIPVANRTDGLLIFNTTTGCFDYWSAIQGIWLSMCGTPPPAVFGISADQCTQIASYGAYKQGVALTLSNYLTVPVTAIQPGTYTISATTTNGYYFTTSGTFPSAGSYTLNLPGTGTPNNGFIVGDPGDPITISLNGVATTCIPHVYVEKANVDFAITCASIAPQGSYNIGIPLAVANKLSVEVNVTNLGFWSMSTNTVNGYSFSGTGTYTSLGIQTINLLGTGTPIAAGTNNFNLSSNALTPGSASCSGIPVTVAPVAYTIDCATATQNGTYMQNVALIGANTVSLPVNVTATGQTTISTTTASGITFTSGLINLSTLGPQTVTLNGSGTPTASGTITLTVTGTPGSVGTCPLSITTNAQPVTYTTNCGGIAVAGIYSPGVAMDATNTMTVPVTVTYVGTYTITTNTVNGISFSGTGTFTATGLQSVVLTATGTPVSGGNFPFAITANSTNGGTACNKTVSFVIRLMNVLGLGSGDYQPGSAGTGQASRAVIASTASFGPTGTVQVDGIKIFNGGTNTGTTLRNLINNNKIDIIIIGYNYTATDAATLNTLADFVKNKKGVLIQAQENGNTGIATLVNSICGSTIVAGDITTSGATLINPLASIADPVLNGPFGNITGLAIGGDNNNSYSMTLPANTTSIATISGLPARVTTFKHNTLGYIFCGDGGLMEGNSSNTSTTNYPAKITTTGLPLSKIYDGGTTVYNSIFYANAMAWAIGYVQDNINVNHLVP